MVESGVKLVRYGGTMVNNPAYKFKSMIGAPETRSPFRGFWYRYASLGFGVVEFVDFCRAAGFESVIAICIEETPGDVADMVEYFNGSADTKWGARRVADGYPESFNLKYIEIGNEEGIGDFKASEGYSRYIERFKILRAAMAEKDANLQFFCAAWWDDRRLDALKQVYLQLDGICDFWDIHLSAGSFKSGMGAAARFASIRKLFAEWKPDGKMRLALLEENGSRCDMHRALVHACILSAVRNNMDFVLTSCPANALQAANGRNFNGWNQGQIHFDKNSSWGAAPFQVQKMDSQNFLPRVVEASADSRLSVSAATDADNGDLAVYVTNPTPENIAVRLDVSNFSGSCEKAKVFVLRGNPTDNNTARNRNAIFPVESFWNFKDAKEISFAPYSHTVLRFNETSGN